MRLMVNYLFTMLLVCAGFIAQAQEFTFNYHEKEMEEVEAEMITSNHPFGEEFTVMMQLLRESYTYQESNSISLTTSTIVEKPVIYYSVRKVSKHYVKSVKKGKISEEDAKKELEDVLVKALNIRHQNTVMLEEKLGGLKDMETISALYTKEIRLDM